MNIGNLFAINGKIETEALSVVCVQYAPIGAQSSGEVAENTETVLDFIDQSVSAFPGVDLIVFPEACIQGFAPVNYEDAILDADSPHIERIKERCRVLSVWGVFNFLLWTKERLCYENTAYVINDLGETIYTYVKKYPWIPFENSRPGTCIDTCEGPKGAKLGIIICADGDYSEAWRDAAVSGANIIVRPAHYIDPFQNAWEITNRAGAFFNQVYVVAPNTSGMAKNETRSCFGRSMILGPDGNIITEGAAGTVCLIKADLYPGIIDKMHEQAVHGNPLFSYDHRGASCPEESGRREGLKK